MHSYLLSINATAEEFTVSVTKKIVQTIINKALQQKTIRNQIVQQKIYWKDKKNNFEYATQSTRLKIILYNSFCYHLFRVFS